MTDTACYSYLNSPLGKILVLGHEQFVTGLYLPHDKRQPALDAAWRQSDAAFRVVREQLAQYFAGERRQFDAPLKFAGTPFQRRVWQELTQISFGETISYAQIAQRVGQPTAARAVGHAIGRNPILILVPCHRVIGASGQLTGYAGGLANKQWLLDWERGGAVEDASLLTNIKTASRQ